MTTKQKSGVLLGVAIAGLLGTGVAAIWADRKRDELEYRQNCRKAYKSDDEEKKSRFRNFVDVYWPYAVPVATASVSIGAMIAMQIVDSQEMKRLAGVASMSLMQLSQCKSAVREIAGDEVANKIEQNMAPIEPSDDEIDISEILMCEDVITCYDELTDTMFETTPMKVQEARLEVNRRVNYGEYVEVNDWRAMFGLDNKPEFYGLGWTLETICRSGVCWVEFAFEMGCIDDMQVLIIKCKTPIDELSHEGILR